MRHINYANSWLMGIDPVATGRQLKKLRRQHNFTQEDLSELFEWCDISASRVSISVWENGKKNAVALAYCVPGRALRLHSRRAGRKLSTLSRTRVRGQRPARPFNKYYYI